jgi:uncharacterized protein (DUF58 family)
VSAPLFSAEDLRRLDRLRIVRRRTLRGEGLGEWRSARIGAGGMFADHRDYVPGDDLRYVDWNVYGRLGDLVVKRFEAEENLNLLLCVDRSLSMAGPKALAARRLAGALGYIALGHQERVRLAWLPAASPARVSVHRGRGAASQLLEELASTPDDGRTALAHDLARIPGARGRKGIAVLVSDFFDPAGAVGGLARLRGRAVDVAALHVVDPSDLDLPLGASIRAVDRETGETVDVDVTEELLDGLHAVGRRRAESLERWCLAREIPYQRVSAARPVWDTIHDLVRRGVAVEG